MALSALHRQPDAEPALAQHPVGAGQPSGAAAQYAFRELYVLRLFLLMHLCYGL